MGLFRMPRLQRSKITPKKKYKLERRAKNRQRRTIGGKTIERTLPIRREPKRISQFLRSRY